MEKELQRRQERHAEASTSDETCTGSFKTEYKATAETCNAGVDVARGPCVERGLEVRTRGAIRLKVFVV